MTQHVFTNSMVAHVWAQHVQGEGRNGNGSFSFLDDVLYSYATPIARLFTPVSGSDPVALIVARTFSITTSQHQSLAHGAVGWQSFTVPSIGAVGGMHREPDSRADLAAVGLPDHEYNLRWMVSNYNAECDRLYRARDWSEDRFRESLTRKADNIENYCRVFGLNLPELNVSADVQTLVRHHEKKEARLNSPEHQRKLQRDRERREQRRREREQRQVEEAARELDADIADWRNFKRSHVHTPTGVLLRINGERLETSIGMQVPLSRAIRIFRLAKLCRQRGEPFVANGGRVRISEFTVNSITANGDISAGCHFIRWPEIEKAAEMAGVADREPSDDVVEYPNPV